jgi:putative ABC transport system substrate-binding protein
VVAQAQQSIPTVGYLHGGSANPATAPAFRKGLADNGFVEGTNVAVVYRWADDHYDRLPSLAAELVRLRPAVIFAAAGAAEVVRAETKTIPIVFLTGGDPVSLGLVATFNRPGGNATGINFMNGELTPKRLGLLHELLPRATRFALLVNPAGVPPRGSQITNWQAAARSIGGQIELFNATDGDEIEQALASIKERQLDAIVFAPTVLFGARWQQLAELTTRYVLPATHFSREFAEGGGLMSYGSNVPDMTRQAGVYVGRILKGEKPADLPVLQPTKCELVINLKTAKALGLTIPETLLATADEVIQ